MFNFVWIFNFQFYTKKKNQIAGAQITYSATGEVWDLRRQKFSV